MSTLTQHLGRGWAFPIAPGSTGGLEYAEGADKVLQSIRVILDTEPGERIMRPTFGCGLRRYLMKPNTVATRALMEQDITRSLQAWEQRIDVKKVQVLPASDDPARVDIHISYVHTRDQRPGNLVYPFYLE
jgi:phage baseplate assembly protein W